MCRTNGRFHSRSPMARSGSTSYRDRRRASAIYRATVSPSKLRRDRAGGTSGSARDRGCWRRASSPGTRFADKTTSVSGASWASVVHNGSKIPTAGRVRCALYVLPGNDHRRAANWEGQRQFEFSLVTFCHDQSNTYSPCLSHNDTERNNLFLTFFFFLVIIIISLLYP